MESALLPVRRVGTARRWINSRASGGTTGLPRNRRQTRRWSGAGRLMRARGHDISRLVAAVW